MKSKQLFCVNSLYTIYNIKAWTALWTLSYNGKIVKIPNICIKVIAKTLKVPEGCFTLDKIMLRKNRRSTHTFEPLSGQWLPVCFMQIKANSFKQFVHLCKSISVR